MNRITVHHSGGSYTPNLTDLKAYHGVIDGDGQHIPGKFKVEDNAPGKIRKGHYAAHTWKLNTGNIGRCIGAMGGGMTWASPYEGKYPVLPVQVDALVAQVAKDVIEYGIPVTRRTVLSHAEVQPTLGVTQRNKWDFDYGLRGPARRNAVAIGDEFRQEVLLKVGSKVIDKPKPPLPTLERGDTGDTVAKLQRLIGANPDGAFGPKTEAAVIRFQRANGLLPDGIVGEMTWAALGQ